ncbi:MAG TPA: heavy-metal-associated domain-containing protein [Armatimonadota bacterium]|jgi:copper chaperone CopZ
MPTLELHAQDITCEGCASAIKRALDKDPGVRDVQVQVDTKQVSVDFDPAQTSEQAIRDRLSRAGYDT